MAAFQFAKARKAEWFTDPKMVGHRWAIENLDALEAVINKVGQTGTLAKWVASKAVDEDSDDWHYFASVWSKKSMARLQYVLKRVDAAKSNMMPLYLWLERNSPMLKERLTHVMEILVYKYDRTNRELDYARNLGLYGMGAEEAVDRLARYVEKMESKYGKAP